MIDTPTEDCRDRRFDARDDSVGIEIERYLSFAAFLLSERRAGNLCVRHLDGKREVASLEILESGLERSTLRSCKGNPTIAKTILDKPKREFWEDKIPRGPAVVIRLLALVAGETRTAGAVVETLFPLVGYLLIIGGVLFAITAELEPLVFRPIRLSVHGLDLDLAEELTQARARVQAEPEKVKPAWDLGRVKLEVYVNRNLNQIAYIFWLSVAVMTVGFAFIFFGISRALSPGTTVAAAGGATVGGVTPAVVGTVAGIITEFIGATFLILYRSTIQQAAGYTKALERINAVGMAMQILDTLSGESRELQDRTKAEMVKLLLSHGEIEPEPKGTKGHS